MAPEVPDANLAEAERPKRQLCRLDAPQASGGDDLPERDPACQARRSRPVQPSTPIDRASRRSCSLVMPASARGERTPSSAAAVMPGRSSRCVSEAFVPSTTQA